MPEEKSPFSAAPRPPLLMGIINVTPDSFSGDGLLTGGSPSERALAQARQMRQDGADLLDIGGESTRPGAESVSAEEEIRRIVPVIEAIHAAMPEVPLSVDTTKPDVAEAALCAGATILNDISGIKQEPSMRKLAAAKGAALVLMHNKARAEAVSIDPTTGGAYEAAIYDDVVADVRRELLALADLALAAGVSRDRLILDPGIGFGKTPEQNRRLIHHLDKITALGFPVLLAASRKNFIGETLGLPQGERLEGTAAVIAIAALRGAAILRVHDVKFMARTARMAAAIAQS